MYNVYKSAVSPSAVAQVLKVMAPNARIFAIKKVFLKNCDKSTKAGFFEEVDLLRRLRGKPGIIQLVDSERLDAEELLYVVLEYGEIALEKLLQKKRRQWGAHDPWTLDAEFIGGVWKEMLRAVGVCSLLLPTTYCRARYAAPCAAAGIRQATSLLLTALYRSRSS